MTFSQVSLYSLTHPSSHVASSLLNEYHQSRKPVRPIVTLTRQGKIEYDASRPFVHDPSFSRSVAQTESETNEGTGFQGSFRAVCASRGPSFGAQSRVATQRSDTRTEKLNSRISACEAVLASLERYTQDHRRINETRETLRRLRAEQADLDLSSL